MHSNRDLRDLRSALRTHLAEIIKRPALFAVSPSVAEGMIFQLVCVMVAIEAEIPYDEAFARAWDARHNMYVDLCGEAEAFRFLCQTRPFASSVEWPEPHEPTREDNWLAFRLLSERSRELCRRVGLPDIND